MDQNRGQSANCTMKLKEGYVNDIWWINEKPTIETRTRAILYAKRVCVSVRLSVCLFVCLCSAPHSRFTEDQTKTRASTTTTTASVRIYRECQNRLQSIGSFRFGSKREMPLRSDFTDGKHLSVCFAICCSKNISKTDRTPARPNFVYHTCVYLYLYTKVYRCI